MPQLPRLAKALCLSGAVIGLSLAPTALADDSPAADSTAAVERIAVGQEAPDFTLTSSADETYSLSDLRGEKNLLMIFFRGTW